MTGKNWIPLKQAAQQLGENAETTRLRAVGRELVAEQRGRGRQWFIESQSLASLVSTRDGSQAPDARLDRLESKIDLLASGVEQLRADVEGVRGDRTDEGVNLDALGQERDRYRAEASTFREAAIRANAGQRAIVEGFRKVLDAVEENANALSELLGPQSPNDVAAHPEIGNR